MHGHVLQDCQHFRLQHGFNRLAYAFQAGSYSASGSSDLIVRCTLNPLFEIDQTRADKHGMCVGINKSGDYNFTGAIDLGKLFATLPDPGVAQRIFCRADRNDLTADAEYCAITDDPEFLQFNPAARARVW